MILKRHLAGVILLSTVFLASALAKDKAKKSDHPAAAAQSAAVSSVDINSASEKDLESSSRRRTRHCQKDYCRTSLFFSIRSFAGRAETDSHSENHATRESWARPQPVRRLRHEHRMPYPALPRARRRRLLQNR